MIEQDHEQEQKILLAGLLDTDRNLISKFYLGSLYYHGNFFNQNYANAFKYYMQVADSDDNCSAADKYKDFARYNLGIMLLHGKGVTQDFHKAFKWINLAASNGDAEALWLSGQMYQVGIGVNPDYEKAFNCYSLAANKEHPLALIKINQNHDNWVICWPFAFISIMKERNHLIAGNVVYPVSLATCLELDKVKKIVELYHRNRNIYKVNLIRDIGVGEGIFYNQYVGRDAMIWLWQIANHGIHQSYCLIGEFYAKIINRYSADYADLDSHQQEMHYVDKKKFLTEDSKLLPYRKLIYLTTKLQELNLIIIAYTIAQVSFTKAVSGGYNKARSKLNDLQKYSAIEQFNHANIMYNYNYIVQKIQNDYKIFDDIENMLRENVFSHKPTVIFSEQYNCMVKDIKNIWQYNNAVDKFKRLLFLKKINKIDIKRTLFDFNLSLLACFIKQKDIDSVKNLLARSDIDVNFSHPLLIAVQNQDKNIVKLLLLHPNINIAQQCNKLLSAEQLEFFKSIIDDIGVESATVNNNNLLFGFKEIVANLEPYIEDAKHQLSTSNKRLDGALLVECCFS